MVGRRSRIGIGLLAVLAWVVLTPPAAALPYEGPGQTGIVTLGDGGGAALAAAALPAPPPDTPTLVRLTDLPDTACRLVLDENGTFALTHALGQAPGSVFLYADTGAHEAPFRIHAVWHLDLKDRCTAEETVAGTVWHDPRGRPFVAPRLVARSVLLEPMVGTAVEADILVTNDGTLPTNVTGRLGGVREGWGGQSVGSTQAVPVGPLDNVTFRYRIDIPLEERPRTHLVRVPFYAESGWTDEAVIVLQLKPNPDAPEPEEPVDLQPQGTPSAAPLPVWTPSPEAPGLHATALVLALLVAIGLLRRRHD